MATITDISFYYAGFIWLVWFLKTEFLCVVALTTLELPL